ncbi:MAG: hypothetical protein M3305_17180 [Actinomycetota bacterium]|nr:hypothetical protein [Actinomycetota bacterium]
MKRQLNLKWGLVIALAAVGLVRPLLSIAGAYEFLGGATGRVVVTILTAAVWVGVVVIWRAPNPLLTLVAVGGTYGIFAILLQQIMWNFFLGGTPEGAPSSGPILVMSWISIVVINVIWGALLGLVATGLRRSLRQRATSQDAPGR